MNYNAPKIMTMNVLQQEVDQLRKFANKVMSHWPFDNEIDVIDIQQYAVDAGLLERRIVTESCGENCICEESDMPTECFRTTNLLIGYE